MKARCLGTACRCDGIVFGVPRRERLTDGNLRKKPSSLLHPNWLHRIKISVLAEQVLMETLRNKSLWGAIVFVAVFVTSIVVLLADNAMSR